ncbi:MAG: 4-hydroxy-3-methylbut-2-enyl diphosphate reductase [Candidatus Omnitrophota bacterium]
MQVKVAGRTGFCFGVKRAINIAERTIRENRCRGAIYSLGPIIHNPQVVEALSKKGLCVIKDISRVNHGTVIICSHGAPKDLIEKIKDKGKGIKLVDATCPFVKYAQDIVSRLKKQGYGVIIVGDKEHPEVKALLSIAEKPLILSSSLKKKGKGERVRIGVISQTTQNKENYLKEVGDILQYDFSEVRIFNTICSDTSLRQALTRRLLDECDVMVVIGGKNSANTRRLWQICRDCGVDSYHIETGAELKKEYFENKKCVGVVSGASTPEAMVKKVVKSIKKMS